MSETAEESFGRERRRVMVTFHERLTHAAAAQSTAGSFEKTLNRRSSPIISIVAGGNAVAGDFCLGLSIFLN